MTIKTSALYSSLRVMTCFYKIAGCPFIDAVYGTEDTGSRVLFQFVRKLLRVTYSFTCVCLSCFPLLTYVAMRIWIPGNISYLNAIIRSGLYFAVYSQISISFFNLALRRGQFAEIFRAAAKLEPKLHINRSSVRRRLLKVSILCLLYAVLDGFKYSAALSIQIKATFYLLRGHSNHVKWLCVPAHILSCLLVAAWYNMPVWHIVYFANIFREYFAALGNRLELELKHEYQSLRGRATGLSTEAVRINLVAIQRLLRSVNAFIGVEAFWYYAGTVYFLCATLYSATIIKLTIGEIYMRVIYVTIMAAGLLMSAQAATRMCEEASKIICIIQAAKFEALTDAETHRLHILILTVEDLKDCFTGCGMFVINLRLIVSVVGAVITYTIVLVQTNESAIVAKCFSG